MKLLQALDLFAELIYLVYQLGLLTRKYVVPAVVYVYVSAEHVYHQMTTLELTLVFPPVTKPHPMTLY